jgi:iron-sulfur cluster assembly accessory protein
LDNHDHDLPLTRAGSALNYQVEILATGVAMAQSVIMTERAARRIGEILKSEPAGAMMRVSVEGGGCSGFQYKFDIEQAKGDDDLVLTGHGAVVLIDPTSLQYMAGAEIDFVDDLIGASFKIKNPVASASCGCGTSFTI